MRKSSILALLILLFTIYDIPVYASGEEEAEYVNTSPYDLIVGPKHVQLGNIASLDIDKLFYFADAENTKQIQVDHQQQITGEELGSIFPIDPDQSWYVTIEYKKSGHVSEADPDQIDTGHVLEYYRTMLEERNKTLPVADQTQLVGWGVLPSYDASNHMLTSSFMFADTQKNSTINYRAHFLTRTGYMSVNLVSNYDHFEEDFQRFSKRVLPKIQLNTGMNYNDFDVASDPQASFGLTGVLLDGGENTKGVAVSLPTIFKKIWFVLVALIVGIVFIIKALIARAKRQS